MLSGVTAENIADVFETHCRTLGLRLNLKHWLRHFARLSPIFTEGEGGKVRNIIDTLVSTWVLLW